jgi:hypothetical protein
MKRSNKDLNDILDRAMAGIRSERVDQAVVESAAERVRAKLTNEHATASAPAAHVEHIRNCDDFQKLIPEYLEGSLSAARSLLFEDHTHECIPCRKALKEARYGVTAVPVGPGASRIPTSRRTVVRWAIAATIIVGIGVLSLTYDRFFNRWRRCVSHGCPRDGRPGPNCVSDSIQGLKVGQEIKPGDRSAPPRTPAPWCSRLTAR